MTYKIERRSLDSVRIAFSSFQGQVSQAARHMPAVFQSIRGQACGAPFIGYLSPVDDQGEAEMMLCVPTEQTPNAPGVEVMQLPGGPAACLTHVGPYSTLPNAYAAMQQYMEQHKLHLRPPCREVYVKGPGMLLKGNPQQYITELVFPLEDE